MRSRQLCSQYVVTELPLPGQFAEGFEVPERIGTFPVMVRSEEVQHLELLLYTKSKAAKVHEAKSGVRLVNHEEPLAIAGENAFRRPDRGSAVGEERRSITG